MLGAKYIYMKLTIPFRVFSMRPCIIEKWKEIAFFTTKSAFKNCVFELIFETFNEGEAVAVGKKVYIASVKWLLIKLLSEVLSWDLVAHPVTQVIGEQALVDILDLSLRLPGPAGVFLHPAVGWG